MSFSSIIGQEQAIHIIKKALFANRVSHAYLFAGPEGVGKKLTALILAKALNCLEKSEDACDACKSCQKIDKGNHPDVGILEADGHFIKIDQIRKLQKQVGYKPFEGRKKITIINDAEKLNLEAANALLKTLEEPPLDTVFILVTSNPNALLQTIISRCQSIRFGSLGAVRVEQFLVERRGIIPVNARVLASLSEGRLGKALNIDIDKVRILREQCMELMNLMTPNREKSYGPSPNPRDLFRKIEESIRDRDYTEELLDFLLTFYRDLLILSERGNPNSLTNQDMIVPLEKYGAQLSSRQILKICQNIYQTKANVRRNANLQLALEEMVLKIMES
jgi:DNA polymerase-3 subunit delta'